MHWTSTIRSLTVSLSVGAVALLAGSQTPQAAQSTQQSAGQEWWRHAVIYEIYPRSFQDSDGDGVGDIKGIASRLDYLHDLGIDAIWITPMYPSPGVDYGYDISDYTSIDPVYGAMADFDDLVAEAKNRDNRVIMD
jgi:alpha-glucosidase